MLVLMFIILLIFTFGVAFYVLRPTRTESAVQQQLDEIQDRRAEETGQTILKEEGFSSSAEIAQIVRQIPGAIGILNLIKQSGQKWMVDAVMGISLLSAVVVGVLASLFVPGTLLAVIIGIAAGSIPYVYL